MKTFETDNNDALDQFVHDSIMLHGFAGIGISGISHDNPSFNYTIGLIRLNMPELIIFGMRPDRGHIMIRNAMRAIKESDKTFSMFSPFESKQIANMRCMLVPISSSAASEDYMTMTKRVHGHTDWPAMQLVWPDTNDLYPWETNDISLHHMQTKIDSFLDFDPKTINNDSRD